MPGVRQGEESLSGCLEEARRILRVELMPEGQCPSAHPGRRSFLDLAEHYHPQCHKNFTMVYR